MIDVNKGYCGSKRRKGHNRGIEAKRNSHGKMPYPLRPFKFITVLREPVDRVVSEYYYIARLASMPHGKNKVELAMDESLLEAYQSGLMAWALSPYNNAHNRMTKQLAFFPSMRAPGQGRRQCTSFGAEDEKQYWSALYDRSVDDGLWATVNQDDELLKNAISSLSDRFAAVAITERMNDSLTVICNAVVREGLPWESGCGSAVIQAAMGADAVHRNKNGHREADASQRARLRQLNRLDVELHRVAVGRLDEQLALEGGR